MLLVLAVLVPPLAWLIWRRTQAFRKAPKGQKGRIVIREVAVWCGVYGAIVLMLLCLERSLVFRPTTHEEGWDVPPGVVYEDVWLTNSLGTRVHGWWCPCPDAEWTVHFSHGNGGNLSHRAWGIAQWQRIVRANVLLYDYPGYGRSEGRPDEVNCCATGRSFYRWLCSARQVPPERLIFFGESLGGGVATELALSEPHRLLACFATFTSIPDMAQSLLPFVPARWLVRTQFDNAQKLRRYRGTLLLGHATHDPVVPFAHGEALYSVANQTAAKEFLVLPDATHGPIPDTYLESLVALLSRGDLPQRVEPLEPVGPRR